MSEKRKGTEHNYNKYVSDPDYIITELKISQTSQKSVHNGSQQT